MQPLPLLIKKYNNKIYDKSANRFQCIATIWVNVQKHSGKHGEI